MRKSDLENKLMTEFNGLYPDFSAMLERINAENVKPQRIADAPLKEKQTAKRARAAKRAGGDWPGAIKKGNAQARQRLAVSATSFCVALMLSVASIFAVGYFSNPNQKPIILGEGETYVSLNINPAVDFTVNKYNKITSAVATNNSGVLLMTKLLEELQTGTIIGRELSEALVSSIKTATKMGYIDVDGVGVTNAVMISAVGKDEAKAADIKNGLVSESKKFFRENGIYAVVVSDYDNKAALIEEAKKSDPNIDPNSSIGDLIASVEKGNADKSAIDKEIEEARANYESYLNKNFTEDKNEAVNSEISLLNAQIKKLEKLLDNLNLLLENKTAEAIESDDYAYIEAIQNEITAKSAEFNLKSAEYETTIASLDEAIAARKAQIKANEASIAIKSPTLLDRTELKNSLEADNAVLNSRINTINNDISANEKNRIAIENLRLLYDVQREWASKHCSDPNHIKLMEKIASESTFLRMLFIDEGITEEQRYRNFYDAALDIWTNDMGLQIAMPEHIIDYYITDMNVRGFSGDKSIRVLYEHEQAYGLVTGGNPEFLSEQAVINKRDSLKDLNAALEKEKNELSATISANTDQIKTLNSEINNLTAELKELTDSVAELTAMNAADSERLEVLKSESESLTNTYAQEMAAISDNLKSLIALRKAEADNLRGFRDGYSVGGRAEGFAELNAVLEALEKKLKSDIEKNDAEALAKSLEESIKAEAEARYNQNVDKYNNHNRQFTEEEYAAWEEQQQELLTNITWDDIYRQWTENQ